VRAAEAMTTLVMKIPFVNDTHPDTGGSAWIRCVREVLAAQAPEFQRTRCLSRKLTLIGGVWV
jgi:hypothetical protein